MKSTICWMCDTNLPCNEYTGTKYLDSDGNKPCLECLLEEGASLDDEEDSKDEEDQ